MSQADTNATQITCIRHLETSFSRRLQAKLYMVAFLASG